MLAKLMFLAAYLCSGLAGLIYQVAWTRLLTLNFGHTTAAASAVVAAFMGGLAVGTMVAGRWATRLTSTHALYVYAALEAMVVLAAVALPYELSGVMPLLSWAYRDGSSGFLFASLRLAVSLLLIAIPAIALGATFPLAIRWFAEHSVHPGRDGGQLYAANTIGAAIGALLAGFILIPAIGISGTTLVGMSASGLAIVLVIALSRVTAGKPQAMIGPSTSSSRHNRAAPREPDATPDYAEWLAPVVLLLTGFATFVYELAWTRALSLILGPTTYAFASTVSVVITGLGLGSAIGSWTAGRVRHPSLWLAATLGVTAIGTIWTTSLVGHELPRLVAQELARSPIPPNHFFSGPAWLGVAAILPTAVGLGIGFPLALELFGRGGAVTRRVGFGYGARTAGGVAGALVAGFVAIPLLGLQNTLGVVSVVLVLAAIIVLGATPATLRGRLVGSMAVVTAMFMIVSRPAWDNELLSSGVYLYPPRVPPGLDLEQALKAGTVLYHRDGAASTVSVKRLAGVISLAIDGKVDASSGSDMPTQKTLAHLPLLLHSNPRDVLIIGLGSGVTAASALVHPISTLDVVELSPEVIDASQYFVTVNRGALTDPRTRLIVGDGRSHLLLSSRRYDVIISEPSNPWMAGVSALFTREFFHAARARLAPDGIICQWAHTYSISSADLRSIVATFLSEFPEGSIWMLGRGDVLLIASDAPLGARLDGLRQAWTRPGVAADLREIRASGPFAFLSTFAAGPEELRRYAGNAPQQTDDRMALEFSGPRALHSGVDRENASDLRGLLAAGTGPPAVRNALRDAGAAEWRDRGEMMLSSEDFEAAYQDFSKALAFEPTDKTTLVGLTRAAVALGRQEQALQWLRSAVIRQPGASEIRLALSRMLAATGAYDEAVKVANTNAPGQGGETAALEQLASIFADVGDGPRLTVTARRLQELQPDAALTEHYLAAAEFLASRFEPAARHALRATQLDPKDAPSQNLLGASYASLGRRAEAEQSFAMALLADPADDTTYVNLGLLKLQSGARDTATRYFAEALSINPRSETARRGLIQARTP